MPYFDVASRTLTPDELTWNNSTLLPASDAIGAIRELRERDGKGVQVVGSPSPAAQLVEHGLVDEYRLMIEPILLGGGKRSSPATAGPGPSSSSRSRARAPACSSAGTVPSADQSQPNG